MTGQRALFCCAMLIAASMTFGCTNTRQDVSVLSVAQSLIDARQAKQQDTPQIDPRIVQAEVDRALDAETGALALVRFEKTGSVAVLRQIAENGPYRTWTTWGTTERRSISTRGGVVTSTRGLGEDLMSSSVTGLLRMVTTLTDGVERQVLRHLDGNHQIEQTVADCAFTPGMRERFQSGELDLHVTRVDVFCKTETGRFSNVYMVSGSGRIVMARQWLGEGLGFVTLQVLR